MSKLTGVRDGVGAVGWTLGVRRDHRGGGGHRLHRGGHWVDGESGRGWTGSRWLYHGHLSVLLALRVGRHALAVSGFGSWKTQEVKLASQPDALILTYYVGLWVKCSTKGTWSVSAHLTGSRNRPRWAVAVQQRPPPWPWAAGSTAYCRRLRLEPWTARRSRSPAERDGGSVRAKPG